ncbi:hypothetical protein HYV64_01355 [Candidatus Shapirobacteria bacterium]|nr:hypothetical protein [Candidatus Shapirobacteria bacterium]
MKLRWVLYLFLAVLVVVTGKLLVPVKVEDTSALNNKGNEVDEAKENEVTIQAWIYPGSPSCNAMKEIADGREIDVLKSEYFDINETGEVTLLTENEHGCNGYSKENINLIKKYSKQQYVVISANHIDMRVLFADEKKVKKVIDTLVEFIETQGLSGIEVDFEDFSSWTKVDYANYKKFVTDLGTTVRDKGKLLMLDGPPITAETQLNYPWNYADFDKLPVNFLLVMAYDYQYDGEKNSYVAPNDWVEKNVKYIMSQVDPKKLVVGVPAYGYHFNDKGQIILDTQEQSMKYPGYEKASISKKSFEYSWQDKGKFYVTQKEEGLSKKINFIKSLGVKNISIWHLGGNPWFE